MITRAAPVALVALLLFLPLRSADAAAPGPVGQIVYVAAAAAPGPIAVVSANGDGQHTSVQTGSTPTWSPAGDKIAYVDGGAIKVMTYTASTGTFGAPTAVPGVSLVTAVAWSPDGTTFAYSDDDDIYTVAVGGGASTNLTNTDNTLATRNIDPTWSPDGTKLAFATNQDGNFEIYTINASGSGQTRLTSSSGTDDQPSWSPDGTQLLFVSNRTGSPQIWDVASAGSADTRLINAATSDDAPAWAPSGAQFAFTRDHVLSTATSSGTSVTAVTGSITADEPEWGLQFGVQTAPSIGFDTGSSTYAAGSVLKADPGTWSGPTQPPSFSYQWLRCNSSGASCVSISGANAQTYTLTAADGGSTIRVTVTATESAGSSSATSAQKPDSPNVVTSSGPTNTVLPRVSYFGAAPLQGTSVSATAGTWTGSPPITYAYQWERCDKGGNNCALAGGTASSYVPSLADADHTLRVKVTATNAAGATTAESLATPVVRGLVPAPVSYPTISTTLAVVGKTITGAIGSWSGQLPITYRFTFEKCSGDGSLCVPLPTRMPEGGTTFSTVTATLAVTSDLIGWRIAFHVYAKNAQGEENARSDLSKPVAVDAPVVSTRPTITGINAVGQQLLASPGVWSSTAGLIAYSYVWQRCDTLGNGCKPIPGATSSTYIQTQDDLGSTIRVYVTASNASGPATAPSDHTYPTLPRLKLKPAVSVPPKVLDVPSVGLEVRMSDGVWTGDKPMRFSRRWRRCDATGARCKVLPLRGKTYTVTIDDLGSTLRAVVVGRNANGASTAISEATDVVLLKKKPRSRRIVGSDGPNYLAGGGGDDTLLGRGGNDTLLGGAGDDLLDGGAGADVLIGGEGKDTIRGGTGSDTVIANDGEDDVIDCGPGRDRAVVDAGDKTVNCEVVQTAAAPEPPTTTSSSTSSTTTTSTTTPTTAGDATDAALRSR